VRTRLRVEAADEDVLRVVGRHLGSLAGEDLAQRCREHKLSAKQRAQSRRERKRAITAASSSRWAGAITRTSEDSWQLAWRNLVAERRTLASRIHRIERRLTVPSASAAALRPGRSLTRSAGASSTSGRGWRGLNDASKTGESRSAGEDPVSRRPVTISMLRPQRSRLAGAVEAERLFICADGEAGQLLGNLTVRWHPDEHWLELRLPKALEHLANRPVADTGSRARRLRLPR